jgi:hypothetical protein
VRWQWWGRPERWPCPCQHRGKREPISSGSTGPGFFRPHRRGCGRNSTGVSTCEPDSM